LVHRRLRLLGFDGQAWIQLLGGLVIGLIALYFSDDHISFGSRSFSLNQQWASGASLPRWRLWLS
jgi:hypothetical protein